MFFIDVRIAYQSTELWQYKAQGEIGALARPMSPLSIIYEGTSHIRKKFRVVSGTQRRGQYWNHVVVGQQHQGQELMKRFWKPNYMKRNLCGATFQL